uniref:Uncharacterized protein n=1 Tax=Oryza rufipogon TaxID=4529 RepID=A0A0E0RGL4_ORYRU
MDLAGKRLTPQLSPSTFHLLRVKREKKVSSSCACHVVWVFDCRQCNVQTLRTTSPSSWPSALSTSLDWMTSISDT